MTNFGKLELDILDATHYGVSLKEYLDYVDDMNNLQCEGCKNA